MKIAFDSQIFTMQEYGGISRYICSLAENLAKIDEVEAKIFAPMYINGYIPKLPKEMVVGLKIPVIPKMGLIFHLSSLWLARSAIAKFSPHILHETYYTSHQNEPKNCKTVVTVYDMIHERFASLFSKNDQISKLKRESVLRADQVICISENTRRDLLELVPVAPEKVSVVYLGVDQLSMFENNTFQVLETAELPYLLFVGGRGHYKNFSGLLKAYASSHWLMNNFKIVCVGGGKLQVDELNLIRELGIPSRQVKQVSASDDLLAEFYRGAAALLYPSMYEGFGIPPLEAMAMNCPVICSRTSSIPEVVGTAGEYFDPYDIESIRFSIERVLQSSERREELAALGRSRCNLFTWDRCAQETLDVYRRIAT